MKYINTQGHLYTGGAMTKKVGNTVFTGIPTSEQLQAWGYEEVPAPADHEPTEEDLRRQRLADIQARLADTDYIILKKAEGRDISEYNDATLHPEYGGDILAWRQALREEYNELERA